MAHADFSMQSSSWQSLEVEYGSYMASNLGNGLQMDHLRQSTPHPNLQGVLSYSEPYANTYSEPHDQN